MREKVGADRVEKFMKAIGRAGKKNARIYFVGGATAVLLGWRETTIDLDIKILPDTDEILRALPLLKEDLQLNIELASPDDFIPPLPGWQERSTYIGKEGPTSSSTTTSMVRLLQRLNAATAPICWTLVT